MAPHFKIRLFLRPWSRGLWWPIRLIFDLMPVEVWGQVWFSLFSTKKTAGFTFFYGFHGLTMQRKMEKSNCYFTLHLSIQAQPSNMERWNPLCDGKMFNHGCCQTCPKVTFENFHHSKISTQFSVAQGSRVGSGFPSLDEKNDGTVRGGCWISVTSFIFLVAKQWNSSRD